MLASPLSAYFLDKYCLSVSSIKAFANISQGESPGIYPFDEILL